MAATRNGSSSTSRARAQLERVPESGRRWADAYLAATPALVRGHLDEAEAVAESAWNLGTQSGQPDAFAIYASQHVCIQYHRGSVHELVPLLEQASEASPELQIYKPATALGYVLIGDHDRATRAIDDALQHSFDMPDDENWLFAASIWARVSASLGHRAAADALHGMLDPYRDALVHAVTAVFPSVATTLGRLEHTLGRLDDADRAFADGDALHQRAESPMLAAEGRSYWAAMLVDRNGAGDRDRARRLAAEALAVAVPGGYAYTESRARELLGRLDQE